MLAAMALRERKQQRARDAIVAAAFDLFAEHPYADVTVADIADRAEVGRTTFFRYFGDKQEVVFANESSWLDAVVARVPRGGRPMSLPRALSLLRGITAEICEQATRDAAHYRRREALMACTPELTDRAARKQRRFAEAMGDALLAQGTAPEVAALAPRVAVACYNAGHAVSGGEPSALGPSVDAAFRSLGIMLAAHPTVQPPQTRPAPSPTG
jgi:AcrR family transcriptional regulator